MMTAAGIKVLEFNVRLGDPETQALMHRLSSDFAPLLMAAARGIWRTPSWTGTRRRRSAWSWLPTDILGHRARATDHRHRSGRGHRRGGVPRRHQDGRGGSRNRGRPRAGRHGIGRSDLPAAIDRSYAAVAKIRFEGMHYRTDIGRKGLKRWAAGLQ